MMCVMCAFRISKKEVYTIITLLPYDAYSFYNSYPNLAPTSTNDCTKLNKPTNAKATNANLVIKCFFHIQNINCDVKLFNIASKIASRW